MASGLQVPYTILSVGQVNNQDMLIGGELDITVPNGLPIRLNVYSNILEGNKYISSGNMNYNIPFNYPYPLQIIGRAQFSPYDVQTITLINGSGWDGSPKSGNIYHGQMVFSGGGGGGNIIKLYTTYYINGSRLEQYLGDAIFNMQGPWDNNSNINMRTIGYKNPTGASWASNNNFVASISENFAGEYKGLHIKLNVNGNTIVDVDTNGGPFPGGTYDVQITPPCDWGQNFTVDAVIGGGNPLRKSFKCFVYTMPALTGDLRLTNAVYEGGVPCLSANVGTTLSWSQTNIANDGHLTYEKYMTNYMKFGAQTQWEVISRENQSQYSISVAELQRLVPPSLDGVDTVAEIIRMNPAANLWSNTKSIKLRVYYIPRVPCKGLQFRQNTASGKLLKPGDHVLSPETTHIYVSWECDTGAYNAGVLSGYRIELRDKNEVVYKTYYNEGKDNKSIKIPCYNNGRNSDMHRGELGSIVIIPYYREPVKDAQGNPVKDSNGNPVTVVKTAYDNYGYDNRLISDFIIPLKRLENPTIDYPITEQTWHNNNFRILFKTTKDLDYDEYWYLEKNQEDFKYSNIEVKINNSFIIGMYNTTGSTLTQLSTAPFSTEDLTYLKKILVNPSVLFNFVTPMGIGGQNYYTMQVRIQKGFYLNGETYTTYDDLWTEWSPQVKLYIHTLTPDNTQKGDIIYARHFNLVRNAIVDSYKCYPIEPIESTNKAVSRGQVIEASNYNGPLITVKDIKRTVEAYCGYLIPSQLQFNSIPEIFPKVGEYVTAKRSDKIMPADPNNPDGRNYIKILADSLNALK